MTGIIFRVEGTLVDSGYLDALAWWRTLRDAGHDVPVAAVHRLIGTGGDNVLRVLIGHDDEDLKKRHEEAFTLLKPDLRPIRGAADLLREVKSRGARVVLATSAPEEDVADIRRVIDADDAIDHFASAGDAAATRPVANIFIAALGVGGLNARDALVVGDTVWDVEAARAAGMACVCVQTGGTGRTDLEQGGAMAVYGDVADLLADIDRSPLARFVMRRD